MSFGRNNGSARAQCNDCAAEWSGGIVKNLGALPGFTLSEAFSINHAGVAVGATDGLFDNHATEWSGSSVINLGGLPG